MDIHQAKGNGYLFIILEVTYEEGTSAVVSDRAALPSSWDTQDMYTYSPQTLRQLEQRRE